MLKALLNILGLSKKDNVSGLGLEIRELLKGKEIDPQKLIELLSLFHLLKSSIDRPLWRI